MKTIKLLGSALFAILLCNHTSFGQDNNYFAGKDAGAVTTGNFDTFVGYNSGKSNTTGYHNTFFGTLSGRGNKTGYHNTYFGSQAGATNETGQANSFFGLNAGYGNRGSYNSFFGKQAGELNQSNGESYFGYQAGKSNYNGSGNSFFGTTSGYSNRTGNNNSFFGYESGKANMDGKDNVFVGNRAGKENTSGSSNVFLGKDAGWYNTTGSFNVFIGRNAGKLNESGSGNVFIGIDAGYQEKGSSKLYIANSSTSTPLVYGEFNNNKLVVNGWLGIGTNNSSGDYKLSVNGKIRAKGLKVETGWADFVFADNYKLRSLEEVATYIKTNKHLPDVPSEAQVAKEGVDLGPMQATLLQKIEELTLYLLQAHEETKQLRQEVEALKAAQNKN
ncbi:MAG: hypothetical protein M3Q05_06305 [Bacteroidota bacterium]|nr:hypothetical protein [Bacteroidota bacterium]